MVCLAVRSRSRLVYRSRRIGRREPPRDAPATPHHEEHLSGADMMKTADNRARTPLSIATDSRQSQAIKLLKQAGPQSERGATDHSLRTLRNINNICNR